MDWKKGLLRGFYGLSKNYGLKCSLHNKTFQEKKMVKNRSETRPCISLVLAEPETAFVTQDIVQGPFQTVKDIERNK